MFVTGSVSLAVVGCGFVNTSSWHRSSVSCIVVCDIDRSFQSEPSEDIYLCVNVFIIS